MVVPVSFALTVVALLLFVQTETHATGTCGAETLLQQSQGQSVHQSFCISQPSQSFRHLRWHFHLFNHSELAIVPSIILNKLTFPHLR